MRKQCVYFGFSKQSPLSKYNFYIELSIEKMHLQIMLSDIGYSNFKRLDSVLHHEVGRQSLHGTNCDNDDLHGHATIVSVTRDARLQPNVVFQQDDAHPHWAYIV
jgi:hypothetical protein